MRLATVTTDSTRITQQHRAHPIGERADHEEHDALGPLHEPDLALRHQRLGARARVAGHRREDQGQRRDQHVVVPAQRRVQPDQPGEQRQVREPIERRVPEGAEGRLLARDVRDLAVDEVEDVGDDHDHAAPLEVIVGEREPGADVDQHADERQDVGVNAERDRGVDDRAQGEHAHRADGTGKGHGCGWKSRYNKGFPVQGSNPAV